MLTKLFSKPIFRISVAILVNENILRASPVLCKDLKNRNFARWSSRKPSKILTPDKIASGGFDTEEFFKSEYTESFENKDFVDNKGKRVNDFHPEKEVKSNERTTGDLDYTVLLENDVTFSKLMTQAGNRKLRRKNDLIMLEGRRLNMDALQAGLKPKKIFFTQKSVLKDLNLSPDMKIPLYKIPYKTIALWSKLECPPGVIGFYNMVKPQDIKTTTAIPVKVICDNVRDPGNMGSIIRVAASVGCTEIILFKGCTDPWDTKVLRSASGGHFHIPIRIDMSWNQHEEFLSPSDTICLADNVSERSNSLAAALPQHLYYHMNYNSLQSLAILIGGETEGLSSDAFQLAAKYNGSRLHIPLSNRMESLNSGCALSVILFEIKRQFLTDENEKEEFSNDKGEMSMKAGI